ncbi:hypothetical protein GY45DRAFT_1373449 [Cubamyces sp. BRFM 1775]|nr:hypothetical protein GY45DRAFT_1373449 [Cubamyces sp. BRFM 1775]
MAVATMAARSLHPSWFLLMQKLAADYAQSGACTDLSLWPSAIKQVDFIGQMKTFLNQPNGLDPDSTLYAIFFGIK